MLPFEMAAPPCLRTSGPVPREGSGVSGSGLYKVSCWFEGLQLSFVGALMFGSVSFGKRAGVLRRPNRESQPRPSDAFDSLGTDWIKRVSLHANITAFAGENAKICCTNQFYQKNSNLLTCFARCAAANARAVQRLAAQLSVFSVCRDSLEQ